MTSSPGSFGLGSGSAGQSMTSLDPGVFMEEYVVALGVALALALISMVLSWAIREDKGRAADAGTDLLRPCRREMRIRFLHI